MNLDLEIEAAFDLEPLAKHFEGHAFVLFLGNTEAGFRLALEPLIKGELNADPVACTEHFLAVLEDLQGEAQVLWSACNSRVLDYGFDGGLEFPPIHIDLPALLLARSAKLGLCQRITVYPFRERSSDE
ncbi:MAG: hypothetical protein ACK5W4_09890 [Inhella sp.]|uniref:hypothetical protein n=1 Tax=Inhella sp. TaxID=1921806 RepID=UPI00391F69C4